MTGHKHQLSWWMNLHSDNENVQSFSNKMAKKVLKPTVKTKNTLTVTYDGFLTWRECDLSHLTVAACTNAITTTHCILPNSTLTWHNHTIPYHPGRRGRDLPWTGQLRCMCVVRAREKEGRLKSLCLLFYELGLYVGFLWGHALLIVPEKASSVIPTLAHTRGLGILKRVLMACHRFRRTQVDPLCLSEILIFEYALSWPACTDKPQGCGLNPDLWSLAKCTAASDLCHRATGAGDITQYITQKFIITVHVLPSTSDFCWLADYIPITNDYI